MADRAAVQAILAKNRQSFYSEYVTHQHTLHDFAYELSKALGEISREDAVQALLAKAHELFAHLR